MRLIVGWIATALLLGPASTWAGERAIDKEVVVAAGLDRVWEAWTTRDGARSFFAPDAHIEARVGGAFEIYFDPKAEAGMRGADGMTFFAIQPKKMISFDWNAPPHLAEARQQRTLVIVRFEPLTDTTTRVHLHQVGWGDGGQWDQAYAYFDRAWGLVLGNLKDRFDKGPHDWAAWLEALDKERAKASQRSN
jgi:uncharacterized protein YndB with AHSA1/START domain